MIVSFLTSSVAKACGEYHQYEGERIKLLGKGAQDKYQHEAQGCEDAVDETQQHRRATW